MAWLKVTQIAQNTFGSGFMVKGYFNLDHIKVVVLPLFRPL